MEIDPKENRDGLIWLFGGGAFAICLTLFMVWADHTLRHSDREKRLGETLKELRTAQASLGSAEIDPRLRMQPVVIDEKTDSHESHH